MEKQPRGTWTRAIVNRQGRKQASISGDDSPAQHELVRNSFFQTLTVKYDRAEGLRIIIHYRTNGWVCQPYAKTIQNLPSTSSVTVTTMNNRNP